MTKISFLGKFILFILLFLTYLNYGGLPASMALDPSWSQALGFALKNGFQQGKDIIFTYGLFGYFYHPTSSYDTDLYHIYMLWQLTIATIIAWFSIIRASQLTNYLDKILYLIILLIIPLFIYVLDSLYFFLILLLTSLIANPSLFYKHKLHISLIGFTLLFAAITATAKFTQFVAAGFAVIMITIIVGQQYGWKRSPLIPLVFISLSIMMWLMLGQDITNIKDFIANSFDVAHNYDDAMSIEGPPQETILASVILWLLIGIGIISAFLPTLNINRLCTFLAIGLVSFLAFKLGLVRHDQHSIIFFSLAALVPFLFDYSEKLHARLIVLFYLFRYTLIILAIAGLFLAIVPFNEKRGIAPLQVNNILIRLGEHITLNFQRLLLVGEIKKYYDNQNVYLRKMFDLPNTRQTIGNATVDIFSYEQGVLLLNQFNWHPRPVFQSYSTYTPNLLTINSNFYASNQAPAFILFKLQTIDNRLPLMDDIEAIKVILRDYHPLFTENGFLLLKHAPRPDKGARETFLLQQAVNLGEFIDISSLNNKQLLLTLEISKTITGELYSFFYKTSTVYLEIITTDNNKMLYRIIPQMMETGVIINPLILNEEDLMKWYSNMPLARIARLRILTTDKGMEQFNAKIVVKFSEYNVLP
ncbi:hypothetical protein [Beggiatoa leptomitoformis]|uniref:Glycosyltransferase RgtA/B/C/D-like domain-containing protein n=1 Tax=Beggiatoa leptomitoformis TaxID=288004 RepID=A0A2N9YAQ8_9GAMM|nr:hypothetical protein [Beggiatoa leptomitoformis]ALG67063.1 hypothetical protein AL038_04200 [Beggiatoa leptomitoformis]AUI67553.1 hypothetical protein BLE401_01810 [Beggiatoa leptomitoformis]